MAVGTGSVDEACTLVTHTDDWTRLVDDTRLVRARATTADHLRASPDRLAGLVEDDENLT